LEGAFKIMLHFFYYNYDIDALCRLGENISLRWWWHKYHWWHQIIKIFL